jgi:hypothetical protein
LAGSYGKRDEALAMTFKPAIWYPIAVVLTLINLVGVGFAAAPWHATVHAALALAFGVWAQRLRPRAGTSEPQARSQALEELEVRFDALEADMRNLRKELNETQERLDFAERLLAQGREARRLGPER